MVILYGISNSPGQEKIGGPFLDHWTKEPIAKFSLIELAEEYVKKNRLKQTRRSSPFQSPKVFKASSLLKYYEDYEIEEEEITELPLNPE